jgi:hypothetical protein
VLAVIGATLGGLEVCLLAAFYDDVDGMPDTLSALVVFCLFVTIPAGIVAAVLSGIARTRAKRLGAPQHVLAAWAMALGFLAVFLGLIGLYLMVGASLNTIGP